MQKELLTKTNYASVGEEISTELATDFVKTYAAANSNEVTAFHIGRNIIEQILAQPECAGIRFYNAINEDGRKTLVYVGIDASGKDIVKKVVVAENGSLNTIPAIVADRTGDGGWDLLTWIFGR